MKRFLALAAALAISAAGTACAHRAAPVGPKPALSGQWVLVKGDLAERAPADTGAAGARRLPERGADGYGGGERGGRGGARSGGGYNRAASYNPEAVQAAVAAVARGADRISIEDAGEVVHFRFADGSYFDLAPDGHGQDDIWRNVGRIKSKAEWTPEGLLLERKLDEGVTVQQTFSRPAGAQRLTVLTVVKGPVPRPIEQRRSYDPAPKS